MRIRNKELRAKRHRKEQTIKDAVRTAKAEAAAGGKKEKKSSPKAAKPAAAKKAAAKKTEEAPAE